MANNLFGNANIGNLVGSLVGGQAGDSSLLAKGFDQALSLISGSKELQGDALKMVLSAVTQAKEAVAGNDQLKQAAAKLLFEQAKPLLTKLAPKLLSSLKNIPAVAGFFGLDK